VAANTLAVSYTDLQTEVALALGWNPTAASWTPAQTNTLWPRINKKALYQAYYPEPLQEERVGHGWSFLKPRGSLTLNEPYSTGTIAIAAGVVTLTGGTWPSWAAAGDLWFNDLRYPVSIRTNGTSITLVDTTVAVSAGESYELIQHAYDLPSDFARMQSNALTYRRDSIACGTIELVHPGDLMRSDRDGSTGTPTKAAVTPVAPTATDDARWQLQFADPIPNQAFIVEYDYEASPPLLDGSGVKIYPYGGPPFSRMFLASYIDAAFQTIRDSFEMHGPFLEALRQAVMYDRAAHAPHSLGFGARSRGPRTFDMGRYLNGRRASYRGYNFTELTS
jgi:hypothetical protein